MNELKHATSPYLLQHADNPVHWREWGDRAFTEARERDVPIFLSVGYSSCHWCHVMAHESFEDPDIATSLNEQFVNIKVDREERPDVDAVYMQAVTALTGHGGWPMSVFLTPQGTPFFGGTYWPPQPRHGMPSFVQVLTAVTEAWQQRRHEVVESAQQITQTLRNHAVVSVADSLDTTVVEDAAQMVLARAWDRDRGGFGRAPKFPQAMTIEWLLDHHVRTGNADARDAAVHALDAMARGGIHDHVGGGFARYATDDDWLVPHFEKMLYDNALLLAAYAKAAAITGNVFLRETAESTARFLLDDFRTEEGLFVAASDADSEGVEGKYFVWEADEFAHVVSGSGEDPALFAEFLGVTADGNWEGVNILHQPVSIDAFAAQQGMERDAFMARWRHVRDALLAHRTSRVAPQIDSKVLADWNGLAVRGLVVAGRLLGEDTWIDEARQILETLVSRMDVDGQLHHSLAGGRLGAPGFVEDYATVALAELELFAVTGDATLFTRAVTRTEAAERLFADGDRGGWFQTAADAEALYLRPKAAWDNATPAGTSLMIEVCLQLADFTGEQQWRERADAALALMQEPARRNPTGFGWTLRQFDALASDRRQLVIVGQDGPERRALVEVAWGLPRPGLQCVVVDNADPAVPLLAERHPIDGHPAAYICRQMVCERPVTTPQELAALLRPER